MNLDFKRWRGCAWLRTLAFQWHKSRGYTAFDFQRPFSRDWEDLLQASNLISAELRDEAFREATELQITGMVDLKTVRYRPYQIERIVIPFTAESRLQEIFADDLPPAPEPKFDFTSINWAAPLSFLTTEFIAVAPDDLIKLNDFLKRVEVLRPIIPIKERSLEIFGDEKRLDALVSSSLFRTGRLDFARDLKCEFVGEPLGWKRGPAEAATNPLMVIENAATWHSYCRWNTECKLFSAVVYGCGNRFVDGFCYLTDVFRELGGLRRVLYFGDLDPRGLEIPQEAAIKAPSLGLPSVEPHVWSYRQLLKLGAGREQMYDGDAASLTLCEWLSDCAEPVRKMFAAGQRLAQEHVGWEFLRTKAGSE